MLTRGLLFCVDAFSANPFDTKSQSNAATFKRLLRNNNKQHKAHVTSQAKGQNFNTPSLFFRLACNTLFEFASLCPCYGLKRISMSTVQRQANECACDGDEE